MKQHIIAGHFGPLDHPTIPSSDNTITTVFDIVSSNKRLRFGIGQAIDDLKKMGIFPSEIGLDLLILAVHVYAADTRISRTTESQDTWTREIHLIVPVSDAMRWKVASPLLERMLNFLTGDLWSFDFRPRPPSFSTLVPAYTPHLYSPIFNNLALFSGGLDSLIGAIDALEAGKSTLLMSHAGEGATSEAQEICFKQLLEHYKGQSLMRLRVWTNIPKGFVQDVESENTTRGRSFLFFTIGVLAGTGLDEPFVLRAPENGLIAINVPLDPLRLGSLSTRTMHPFYIARWNDLLRQLEIPGRIENPYWNKTKGEMMMACANPEVLRHLLPFSISCSSPTKARWIKHGTEQCGFCLPCIIRRAAIEKFLGDKADPTKYTLSDLTNRALDTNQAEGQQIRSFQYMIDRLRAKPNLSKLFIHKPGPLTDLSANDIEELADIYQRGMDEVAELLLNVRT
jgi:7-cyano-7-deazaguanine synthase in queuosine biosynthesis